MTVARDMTEPPAGPPPTTGTEAPAVAQDAVPPGERKPRKLLYLTLPGCWGALLVGCFSFTPSLLPRGGITQGIIWGITAAIGYWLGVLVA